MLRETFEACLKQGKLKSKDSPVITIEIPKRKGQGDFSTSLAMLLASAEGRRPSDLAECLISGLNDPDGMIEKTEIAGPGFINFTIKPTWWLKQIPIIVSSGQNYGRSSQPKGKRIQIEFVSANPTGPLHVGHGRWAAVGNAMANLLRSVGDEVETEFYINDAGRQVRLLGESVYACYQQLFDSSYRNPEDGYRGAYVTTLAQQFLDQKGKEYINKPLDECIGVFKEYAVHQMMRDIKEDLSSFGVRFDTWFSEESLLKKGAVQAVLEELSQKGYLYERDGASWFRTSDFGDDKDRVIRKEDGEYTYLASDIAYHRDKLGRGFDQLVNIWGADHHGYVSRIEAVIQALGYPKDILLIKIGQLVSLTRSGQPVPMSKRSGEYVTLREVVEEVGKDAALFFFLMRRLESHLEFDLELAKRQSTENPVYYVQYAHARISSVKRQAEEQGIPIPNNDQVDLSKLTLTEEFSLIRKLCQYPDMIEEAAVSLEPHRVTFYLQELAAILHNYYYQFRIISADKDLTQARLLLVMAVQVVIRNALSVLGISAPDRM